MTRDATNLSQRTELMPGNRAFASGQMFCGRIFIKFDVSVSCLNTCTKKGGKFNNEVLRKLCFVPNNYALYQIILGMTISEKVKRRDVVEGHFCMRDFSICLTLRRLMSYIYIYMEHPFLMFLDHTQRRSTVGRTPLDE